MEVIGVIYLIWNLVNGKRYVGQTTQPLKKRFDAHARDKKTPSTETFKNMVGKNFAMVS